LPPQEEGESPPTAISKGLHFFTGKEGEEGAGVHHVTKREKQIDILQTGREGRIDGLLLFLLREDILSQLRAREGGKKVSTSIRRETCGRGEKIPCGGRKELFHDVSSLPRKRVETPPCSPECLEKGGALLSPRKRKGRGVDAYAIDYSRKEEEMRGVLRSFKKKKEISLEQRKKRGGG